MMAVLLAATSRGDAGDAAQARGSLVAAPRPHPQRKNYKYGMQRPAAGADAPARGQAPARAIGLAQYADDAAVNAVDVLDDAAPDDTLPAWPHRTTRLVRAPVTEVLPVEELDTPNEAAVERQAQFQPRETAPPLEPAVDLDETAAQKRLRARLVRPFKKMNDIRPYDDYEPDSTAAQQDRCFNLCPRPGSPYCPDCIKSEDNIGDVALNCPECPVELDLRDSSRFTGQSLEYPVRNFAHINYCWEPTNLYSLPLYFQDPCLERYGHTRHYLIQPFFSNALFAAQFFGLPYQMSIDPVWKKRYALGYYRPGQYVPYQYFQVPWNTQAAITEAAVLTGAYFLFAPSVSP